MKKKLLQIITIAGFAVYSQTLVAQNPPSGGGQPQGLPPANAVPIDGGAGILLAGVVGYAYKRLKGNKEE
jgi:hypothetical protein